MEDMIIKKLCTSCLCKEKNCISIEKIETKNYIKYRCLNYKQDINKTHPLEIFNYKIRSNNEKIKAMDAEKAELK